MRGDLARSDPVHARVRGDQKRRLQRLERGQTMEVAGSGRNDRQLELRRPDKADQVRFLAPDGRGLAPAGVVGDLDDNRPLRKRLDTRSEGLGDARRRPASPFRGSEPERDGGTRFLRRPGDRR